MPAIKKNPACHERPVDTGLGTTVSLSIGSNLGDRKFFIDAMERGLRAVLEDVKVSGLMETAPVGVRGVQPPYLNKIVVGRYHGAPRRLLDVCRAIELSLGRKREAPKGPRTADADILLFGDQVIKDTAPPHPLIIPHPEILNRRFCLEGLLMIDPLIIIPGFGYNGLTVEEFYKNMCANTLAQNISFMQG